MRSWAPRRFARYCDGTVSPVDRSAEILRAAASKNPPSDRLRYVRSDVVDIPPTGDYDIAVCYSCFPHFPDPVASLKALAGAVRAGGRVAVAHSDSRDRINQVHREGGELIDHDYLPEMDVMRDLFEGQGLEPVFVRDDRDYYIIIGTRSRRDLL